MNVADANPDIFRRALAAHAHGRFNEAASFCRAILDSDPERFEAWHLLGFFEAARGHHLEALEAYDQAISLHPSDPVAHYNRAVSLHALQRWSDVVASCDAALSIRPEFPEALNNRGNALGELGKEREALASYDAALRLRPDYFEALVNRALVLQKLKRFEDALAACDIALTASPKHAYAHLVRGNVLRQLKRFDEALANFEAVLAPPSDTRVNRGAAFVDPSRQFEALNNRAIALLQLNRFEEAVTDFDAALAIRPDYFEAMTNRGYALRQLRRFDQALASYKAALSIRPDHAETHLYEAFCRLLIGDFERGWEAYEWRWETPQQRGGKRQFSEPMWDGREHIADRTVLIHAEQGLGDTIQFCRYLTMLADKGAKVLLEVQPALKRLLQGLAGTHAVLARGEVIPQFDFHCPLLSLPRAFATRPGTIPRPPHLSIPADLIEKWSSRLSPDGMQVGVVWAGATGFINDASRSIGLDAMLVLRSLPVRLVSLQKELRDEDEATLATHKIAYFGPELIDLMETAALISLMDLVISVDTAVAHLAATLGKETWVLLPFTPDWRWMLDRDDSPWYPSIRLFRQSAAGDWRGVIAAVSAELDARAGGKS